MSINIHSFINIIKCHFLTIFHFKSSSCSYFIFFSLRFLTKLYKKTKKKNKKRIVRLNGLRREDKFSLSLFLSHSHTWKVLNNALQLINPTRLLLARSTIVRLLASLLTLGIEFFEYIYRNIMERFPIAIATHAK